MRIVTIPVTLLLATQAACVPLSLELTSEISGKVVDARTGQPVAGARTYLEAFPTEGTESALGQFHIKPIKRWQLVPIGGDLRSGYILVVEASGYSVARRNWEVGSGQVSEIKLVPIARDDA